MLPTVAKGRSKLVRETASQTMMLEPSMTSQTSGNAENSRSIDTQHTNMRHIIRNSLPSDRPTQLEMHRIDGGDES